MKPEKEQTELPGRERSEIYKEDLFMLLTIIGIALCVVLLALNIIRDFKKKAE